MMKFLPFDPRDDWRGVITRKDAEVHRVGPTMLLTGEQATTQKHIDGLGLRLFVKSGRAEALLKAFKKEVFPTFELIGLRSNGAVSWCDFRAL